MACGYTGPGHRARKPISRGGLLHTSLVKYAKVLVARSTLLCMIRLRWQDILFPFMFLGLKFRGHVTLELKGSEFRKFQSHPSHITTLISFFCPKHYLDLRLDTMVGGTKMSNSLVCHLSVSTN